MDLAPGENATCTINNTAIRPTLTLVKTVVNQAGGTADSTEWTLSAAGPTPITGLSGQPAVTAAPVNAGTYDLTEADGPAGYTAGPWVCNGGTSTTGTTVELQAGQNATCTITNTDQPATLTLVKTVTNNNGGTAVETDWTLTATGPTDISGPTGDPAVTAVPVDSGTYTLAESDGPAGYAAGVGL